MTTRETINRLLPLIYAFAEGKIIQHKYDKWIDEDHPLFNDNPENYRIKPEQILIPFTFEDNLLFRDKWIKHKIDADDICRIIAFNNNFITILDSMKIATLISYSTMLKYYEFEDKSSCGRLQIKE